MESLHLVFETDERNGKAGGLHLGEIHVWSYIADGNQSSGGLRGVGSIHVSVDEASTFAKCDVH